MRGLRQPWLIRAAIAASGIIAVVAIGCLSLASAPWKSDHVVGETFRLVYTSKGDEAFLEKDLTQGDCDARKETFSHAAHPTFPEVVLLLAAGFGHLDCLPESNYADRTGSPVPARP